MKLLLFVPESENEIDEVLMVVPDDYDRETAQSEADDMLGEASLEAEVDVIGSTSGFSNYRPYVG